MAQWRLGVPKGVRTSAGKELPLGFCPNLGSDPEFMKLPLGFCPRLGSDPEFKQKKSPLLAGLNLFSWRKIEETGAMMLHRTRTVQ
jgi:hypothetical protein